MNNLLDPSEPGSSGIQVFAEQVLPQFIRDRRFDAGGPDGLTFYALCVLFDIPERLRDPGSSDADLLRRGVRAAVEGDLPAGGLATSLADVAGRVAGGSRKLEGRLLDGVKQWLQRSKSDLPPDLLARPEFAAADRSQPAPGPTPVLPNVLAWVGEVVAAANGTYVPRAAENAYPKRLIRISSRFDSLADALRPGRVVRPPAAPPPAAETVESPPAADVAPASPPPGSPRTLPPPPGLMVLETAVDPAGLREAVAALQTDAWAEAAARTVDEFADALRRGALAQCFDDAREPGSAVALVPADSADPGDLWVVGDLHGDFLALRAALAHADRASEADGRAARVVLIGDLFDGAPHGHAVLVELMRRTLNRPGTVALIAGNHDEALTAPAEPGGAFGSGVEPCDFSEWLNAQPPDGWERRLGVAAVAWAEAAPRAVLLADGLLLAHGGVPHADLLDGLNSRADLDDPRRLQDFVWTRLHATAPRRVPNRASKSCSLGAGDFHAFCDRLEQIAGRPVRGMIRGHDHPGKGFERFPKYESRPGGPGRLVLTLAAMSCRQRDAMGPYVRAPCLARVRDGRVAVHRLRLPDNLVESIYPEDAEAEPAAEVAEIASRASIRPGGTWCGSAWGAARGTPSATPARATPASGGSGATGAIFTSGTTSGTGATPARRPPRRRLRPGHRPWRRTFPCLHPRRSGRGFRDNRRRSCRRRGPASRPRQTLLRRPTSSTKRRRSWRC